MRRIFSCAFVFSISIVSVFCQYKENYRGNSPIVSVEEAFQADQVVPDVIATAPVNLATVTYPSGVVVTVGKELTPTQVKDVPIVGWDANHNLFYTIVMIDADAPSRATPSEREWQHWLVVNIPGSNQSAGETLSEYVGAGPSMDSGLHRYVFLVYQQRSRLVFNETRLNNTSAYGRPGFSTATFADEYNLSEPIAGNFFIAEYDCYVPELYEQLGL